MIIRGIRSPSRHKTQHQQELHSNNKELQQENKQLRMEMLRMEQRLLDAQQGKRKYKEKYRDAKQKLDIMGLLGLHQPKTCDPYETCVSPKTKTTRIHTHSQEEFHSLKLNLAHSELQDNFSTKPYLPQPQDYYHCRTRTPISSFRDQEQKETKEPKEDPKMLQSLMRLHEQLERLSLQIQQKSDVSPKLQNMEKELYKKMELLVQKVSSLQMRDIERQKRQSSRQKSKSKTTKRYNSSMKAIENIGKQLMSFKVDI